VDGAVIGRGGRDAAGDAAGDAGVDEGGRVHGGNPVRRGRGGVDGAGERVVDGPPQQGPMPAGSEA